MPAQIEYSVASRLPKLAWVARYASACDRVWVSHGRAVECRDRWMVEGVWDGAFEHGDFYLGGHLFGSGIRLDGDAVHFVPSCALVDRLFYCRDGGDLLVANSLVVLLAATGGRLVPGRDYRGEMKAILEGVDVYDDRIAIAHPRITHFHQVFHKTIVARGDTVTVERRIPRPELATFDEYRTRLHERLEALAENAADAKRRTPLGVFGTLSSGYDSTCVTALVRDLGVDRVFTYAGSWTRATRGRPEFATAAIAAALGVEAIELESGAAPAENPEHELLLRAAIPLGQQLPLLSMASYVERHTDCALIFTGYHGDMVWDVNLPDEYANDQLRRHDLSGLDLSELRLTAGFFNVAAPFIFAGSAASIRAISRQPEQAPWRLGNRYDRPISRRIVEGAGVERRLFGMKKGGIYGTGARPVHPELRDRYFAYLRAHGIPRRLLYARIAADRGAARLLKLVQRRLNGPLRRLPLHGTITDRLTLFNEGESWVGSINFRMLLFHWAVEELRDSLEPAAIRPPSDTADAPPTPAPSASTATVSGPPLRAATATAASRPGA